MQFCLREKIFAMVGSNLNELGLFFNHGTIVGHGSPKEAPPPPPIAPFHVALFSITYYLMGVAVFQLILFFWAFWGFFALFQLGWE